MNKWISVKDQLPDCDKTPNSFGVEVLVYPPVKGYGHADANTAFFGCRVTNEPSFYLYGSIRNDITHWMPIPAPPGEKNVFNPVVHVQELIELRKKCDELKNDRDEVFSQYRKALQAIGRIEQTLEVYNTITMQETR